MEYLKIKDNIKIPILGLGTWEMGGRMTADGSRDQQYIKAIQTAIELGYEHIDTAEMYGNGHAEQLVGQAIKIFNREKLFITTKVQPHNLAYDDLLQAAEASLKRLGTEYMDLYLIHKPNFRIPISETMAALDELVRAGKTRFIGVSNFSVNQLEKARLATDNPIITNQIEYNLIAQNKGDYNRNMGSKIVPYCQKHDIIITAYRPLAKGKLAREKYRILHQMGEKYDKTPVQVAINWLVSQKNVITIPKASSREHLAENLGGIGWKLSRKDRDQLANKFSDRELF